MSRSNHGTHATHLPHPSQSSAAGELQAILAVWEAENDNPSFSVKPSLIRFATVFSGIEGIYIYFLKKTQNIEVNLQKTSKKEKMLFVRISIFQNFFG